MSIKNRIAQFICDLSGFLFIGFAAVGLFISGCISVSSQTPSPTPSANSDVLWNGYKVTSDTEFGFRASDVSGNVNKYKSDLNYSKGFRVFDTNLLLQSNSAEGRYFDSLLFSSSGWGSDPNGYVRLNMEKTGAYKFNATVRRVHYFNNLSNHALGQHTQNWKTDFGDFDLKLLPQDERIRISVGASYANNKGPGTWTIRGYGSNASDEWQVNAKTNTNSIDSRIGAEGKLAGFDYGMNFGVRTFKDNSFYESTGPNLGNNPTNTSTISTFSRTFPTTGHDYFSQFHLHRTFAEKLDFTARLIYTSTTSKFSLTESITGRDSANNFVDLDSYFISGDAKRPQTRGDLGLTYNVNDKFRISNTFSFDQFTVNGGEAFYEQLNRRNGTTLAAANLLSTSSAYRVNGFKKYLNTTEADFQINNAVGLHIGYRYSHRKVDSTGFDNNCSLTVLPALCTRTNVPILESAVNSTNTVIAGMKIKPVKNWVIYWDLEKGQADNVFTRLENYKFTNFRVRTRYTANNFGFNFSVISKDNENPSKSFDATPVLFPTSIEGQIYSGTVDWSPDTRLSISSGYTYNHLTSSTPIRVPVGGAFQAGSSQFFMRDNYAFFDISAKPAKRLSFYASYRIDFDKGQRDLFSTAPQNIISSYPMQFLTPEIRAVIRLSRNVDWNIGYQYYNFHDAMTPTQNYRAGLPYTSIKLYFGNRSSDR